MKKIISVFAAICLLLGLCACGEKDVEENPTLRIGVFEPFSGPDSSYGMREVLGIQYAHSLNPTVKIGSTTYDIELVYADNASSALQAADVAAALLEKDVCAVIGSYGSEVSKAAGPVFEKAGVAAVGASCTDPDVTSQFDSYFRICFEDNVQGAVLANFAVKELGLKTVLCLGQVESEYDQGLINGFRAAAENMGVTVIKLDFADNCSDFSYYINSAVEQGAEAIFAPCAQRYAKLLVEQVSKLENPLTILSGDRWDSYELLEAAAGKEIKVYVSAFYSEGGDSSFENGFKEWLNADANALANNGGTDSVAAVSVMGYDAYNLVLAAIKAAGSAHHADILAAMPSVTSVGISGSISFNDQGDAVCNSAYIKRADTENIQWKYIKNQKAG